MHGRPSRLTGLAALVAFVATLTLPFVSAHHVVDPDVDGAWGAWLSASNHPVPQVESVHPPVGGGHCAICHWARALDHAVADAGRSDRPAADSGPAGSPVIDAGGADATGPRSPRGPPPTLS